jgi:hypothetical protein
MKRRVSAIESFPAAFGFLPVIWAAGHKKIAEEWDRVESLARQSTATKKD